MYVGQRKPDSIGKDFTVTDSDDANLGCDRGRRVNVSGRWMHGCQDVTVWMSGVLVHAAPGDPVLTLLQVKGNNSSLGNR